MLTGVDEGLRGALLRDGFVVCRLLDAAGADALRRWWLAADDRLGEQQFRSSIMSPDTAHRARAHEVVCAALAGSARRLAPGFRVCLGSFTVKLPGPRGRVQLHQDWTFVDESRWWSLGFWCALQDIGTDGGCLEVLPSSHRLRRGWRGAQQECPLAPLEARLRDRLQALPLRAGEAVFFTQALAHASSPFGLGAPRVCASLLVLPHDAPLLHVRADGDDLEVWEVPDDYYVGAPFGGAPAHASRRVAPTVLDLTELVSL